MKGEQHNMTEPTRKSLARRTAAVGLVVTVVGAGMVGATALASSGGGGGHLTRHARTSGLVVFVHHPKGLARIARAGASAPPAGAILAAVMGRTELFVSQSGGSDCLTHLTVGASGGGGCTAAAKVEREGSLGVFQEGEGATAPGSAPTLRITGMLPNGVNTVLFTDRDGSSYDVAVTNNVIAHEDLALASVSYVLPGGETKTMDVAALVDRTPRKPGAAGSSRVATP